MRYKIKKGVLWREVEGEVVIVKEHTHDNCYLNYTGSEVWNMIDKGMDVINICSNLTKVYNADLKRIEKDVEIIINDLISSKIIEMVK